MTTGNMKFEGKNIAIQNTSYIGIALLGIVRFFLYIIRIWILVYMKKLDGILGGYSN